MRTTAQGSGLVPSEQAVAEARAAWRGALAEALGSGRSLRWFVGTETVWHPAEL